MSAPAIAMAGAALYAVSVTFCICDGLACLPVRRTFRGRRCLCDELTALPFRLDARRTGYSFRTRPAGRARLHPEFRKCCRFLTWLSVFERARPAGRARSNTESHVRNRQHFRNSGCIKGCPAGPRSLWNSRYVITGGHAPMTDPTVQQADGLTFSAYPGDGAVLLAFDLDQSMEQDLAGFAVEYTDQTGRRSRC